MSIKNSRRRLGKELRKQLFSIRPKKSTKKFTSYVKATYQPRLYLAIKIFTSGFKDIGKVK